MYKLLIVDDEPLERQVLRFFVENSKLELGPILECGNGVDAVRLALTEQPDICILDIKMPGLSGPEVMEQLKSVNPGCRVIFSTAYSYFDYAVKALQMGALDFLVKPVKKETLIRVLGRAVELLDKERGDREYQDRVTDMSYVLEKRILRELVTGQIDEETLWFLEGMHIPGDAKCASFFWRLERELSEEEKMRLSRLLRREMADTGYTHLLFVHRSSIDFLVFGSATLQTQVAEETVFSIFDRALEQYDVPARGAAGDWKDDVFQLEDSYGEARRRLNEADAPPAVDYIGRQGQSQEEESRGAAVPPEIKAICTYLEENYTQRITLEEITQRVGFSKYYGGRLFKQYMGTTIIDYLIQIRISKAKELLSQGEHSIKQISFMVGYRDPNYFTWSFKKATGLSPAKYQYLQNQV